MVPLVGHTPGHTGVAVETAKGWLLHCGDALPFGGLDSELESMPVGDTRWVAEHFVDDLFLAELVEGWLHLNSGSERARSSRSLQPSALSG